MVYKDIHKGIFLRRPNRFIAEVEINGGIEICHVKNTGRCADLLQAGATVFVERSVNPRRSTKYDLVSVYKGERLINMDSQAPNRAFGEYLMAGGFMPGITLIKPESRFGGSRLDFYAEAGERKAFIEVKGVTLEDNGVALFPDAPTQRGVKHLNELTRCAAGGYDAFAVFVIQMKPVDYFTPNNKTHPQFGAALAEAVHAGVSAMAFDCEVTADSMAIGSLVEIRL
ncbi:MAG: DNA/RNA nuclease SfsA [Clostridiales bacterium]|jgi:sugar fermentation stimulation protein A|nr:DNA/RNA nuclease SfsA [Clostridiales bacterium]